MSGGGVMVVCCLMQWSLLWPCPAETPPLLSAMVHSDGISQEAAPANTDHVSPNALVLKEVVGKQENVALVTLNRPKAFNALNDQLIDELNAVLNECDNDEAIKVIVLTGSQRAFSAGADIREMRDKSFADVHKSQFPAAWNRLAGVRKPLIAAVNGVAFGGGCELALMCDIVYAGDNALFAQPEVTVGTIPGAGGTQRWTRVAGKSVTMELCLTGDKLSAQEAKECGIVSKVYPCGSLVEETIRLAERIAQHSPLIVSVVKEAVNAAYETTLHQGLLTERRLFHDTFATEDLKEGMRAFVEKRSPQWTNQ